MASVCKQKNGKPRVMWYDEFGKRRSKTFEHWTDAEEFASFLNDKRRRTDHIERVNIDGLWRDPRCITRA